MIQNLPPEFTDLEIHVQDLLVQVADLIKKIEKIEKRLKDGGL